jgi:hypothetical protein
MSNRVKTVTSQSYRTATATAGSPQLADMPELRCISCYDCSMPLTSRPTGLSSPAYWDWLDYVIVADDRAVERIYEDRHTPPDLRWFWSITVHVDPKQGITTSGRAASLDEAKTQFLTNWQRCGASFRRLRTFHPSGDCRRSASKRHRVLKLQWGTCVSPVASTVGPLLFA